MLEIQEFTENLSIEMKMIFDNYILESQKIFADSIQPNLLEKLKIEYYGVECLILHISSVSLIDDNTLIVKVFDEKLINLVEKCISSSKYNLITKIDNDVIFVTLPPLTFEEKKYKRLQYLELLENSKYSISQIYLKNLEKMQDFTLTEEQIFNIKIEIEQINDEFLIKIFEINLWYS